MTDLLDLPVFVVNLDRCPERLAATTKNIKDAGFKNVNRFRAVDGRNENELVEGWEAHGNPSFDAARVEFVKYKGEQGCALSHLNLWSHIIAEQIPMAVVFEDDVYFHKDWDTLSKRFWASTPPAHEAWDILFMGNQMELKAYGDILRVPVYTTHAYVITLMGARRLYDHYLNFPRGVCAIDCVMIETMWKTFQDQTPSAFTWLVWCGQNFPDPRAVGCNPNWAKRNTGLIFQDPIFGTDVRPRDDENIL